MQPATSDAKTRLLSAALKVIRTQGYNATTVDDICAEAGLSKGSFFHHFKGKLDLALAAVAYWNAMTGAFFAQAPYHAHADARDRVLAYIDFRASILQGEPPEFSCLLGTLVQETFALYPELREACKAGIEAHAALVAQDLALAKARYAPKAQWQPMALARYTQAVLQGGFILAKAHDGPAIALQCVQQLRQHVAAMLPLSQPKARAKEKRT